MLIVMVKLITSRSGFKSDITMCVLAKSRYNDVTLGGLLIKLT